jgi:pyruvate,orthophosphate dikinase
MSKVLLFNEETYIKGENLSNHLGIRGADLMGLASLSLPLAPGFIFDHKTLSEIDGTALRRGLKEGVKSIESYTKKIFGGPGYPLTIKVVMSPSIQVESLKSIHNIGLNTQITEGFAKLCGEEFAYGEFRHLIEDLARRFLDVKNVSFQLTEKALSTFEPRKTPEEVRKGLASILGQAKGSEEEFIQLLVDAIGKKATEQFKAQILEQVYKNIFGEIAAKFPDYTNKDFCAYYLEHIVPGFPQNPMEQLELVIAQMRERYSADPLNKDIPAGIIVQMMAYGNLGDDSYNGSYFTRNIVNGEAKLSGYYGRNEFWTFRENGKDISSIDAEYLDEFERIAKVLEHRFYDIREVKFTIEEKKIWLVEQKVVELKSTRAELRTLLDLHKEKVLEEEYLVSKFPPKQLNDLLHPVVDSGSADQLEKVQGGIAGSPGAARGRVFFTTQKLLEAYKDAQISGEDTDLILAMEATYAGDVQAIEIGKGVISSEGGYSSHAPVVARSLGKSSIVFPEIEWHEGFMLIGGVKVNEGDYISLEVPTYEAPRIYMGKVNLVYPNIEENGLKEFISIVSQHTLDFQILTNADTPHDATVAKNLGATGIGLCRTEHMFFQKERIVTFRELLIADTVEERLKALEKLKPLQKEDFKSLFQVMDGYEVTIRLLDAPLHEFLPHSDVDMQDTLAHFKQQGIALNEDEIQRRFGRLKEINPMLGHRGCRVAISHPEIYEMQVSAVLEAAYEATQDGVEVNPNIMIPIVMNDEEVKFIKNGRNIEGTQVKGVRGVVEELCNKWGVERLPFDFHTGTMIELPSAALSSGHIAKQAEFFSFGTNDLTQTTHGLSRDDINSFLPAYTQYDILQSNPFEILTTPVKELISQATLVGRLTRPDLKIGLCGEHGAVPRNIEFCIETGLNYVSCSPYGVPLATLAVAQYKLSKDK